MGQWATTFCKKRQVGHAIKKVEDHWFTPCFAFLVNPFNVKVVGDGCPVHQPFVTNLTVAEIKLAEMQENLTLKKL